MCFIRCNYIPIKLIFKNYYCPDTLELEKNILQYLQIPQFSQ